MLGAESADLSDADVLALRDQMHAIANCLIDQYTTDRDIEVSALRNLSPDARQAVEERAAVLEFDAHVSRRSAFQRALTSQSNSTDR